MESKNKIKLRQDFNEKSCRLNKHVEIFQIRGKYYGLNWSGCGTMDVEETKDFIETLNEALDLVETLNKEGNEENNDCPDCGYPETECKCLNEGNEK